MWQSLSIITLMAAIAVGADWLLKIASTKPFPWLSGHTLIAALIYGATAFGWVHVMRTVKLATIGAVFSMATLLLMVMLGTLVFGERLKTMEWIGIAFAIISVGLLSRFA